MDAIAAGHKDAQKLVTTWKLMQTVIQDVRAEENFNADAKRLTESAQPPAPSMENWEIWDTTGAKLWDAATCYDTSVGSVCSF